MCDYVVAQGPLMEGDDVTFRTLEQEGRTPKQVTALGALSELKKGQGRVVYEVTHGGHLLPTTLETLQEAASKQKKIKISVSFSNAGDEPVRSRANGTSRYRNLLPRY